MKNIKRYSLEVNEDTDTHQILEVDTGLFCLYSDYLALEQQIVATNRKNDSLQSQCFLTGGMD